MIIVETFLLSLALKLSSCQDSTTTPDNETTTLKVGKLPDTRPAETEILSELPQIPTFFALITTQEALAPALTVPASERVASLTEA